MTDDRIGRLFPAGGSVPADLVIAFGEGRPYSTMTVARYAAFGARKLASTTVDVFDVQMAIDEARRHLAEDDHA